jgi:tetratricopeptide (TPR) repeat protein
MAKLDLKYRTYLKALPPRPIRLNIPGWSGLSQKMIDGSEPQPWHCLPFTEGSTYGLELVYEFDNECHVVNDGGLVRFDWDYAGEPDCKLQGSEFITFFPKAASKYYALNTSLDLQAPEGYVIRTEPHPRFFTDDSGTVPLALIGHVQYEWWPKKFFVVFRAPPPGGRHVFRKGEPYVQLLIVPRRADCATVPMSDEEAARRRELEEAIVVSSLDIAKNIWRNPASYAFNDHYKILARAFERDGLAGVDQLVDAAEKRRDLALPGDKSTSESLEIGAELEKDRKFREAFAVYNHILKREPGNSEAAGRMGVIAAIAEKPALALELMERAVALDPLSPSHRSNLGEMLRRTGRYAEAETSLRSAAALKPGDP